MSLVAATAKIKVCGDSKYGESAKYINIHAAFLVILANITMQKND